MSKMLIRLSDVTNSDFFESDIYLDDRYVLLTPQTPLTTELRNSLRQWGFSTILGSVSLKETMSHTSISSDILEYEMGGIDREHIITVRKLYEDILLYLQTVYKELAIEELLSPMKVAGRVKQLIDDVRSHRNYFLRFELLKSARNHNFIIESSVRVTILTILVGITLKIPIHRIIELGTATMLVKVGMLRIPAELYLSSRKLNQEERKILLTHPVVAYKRLKKSSFNPNICAAILDSNERLDGSGYPRKLNGNQITLFSRILAVCLFYVAKTFPRPGRSALNGHYTMLELLKMSDKQYDGTVIKALLQISRSTLSAHG